MKPRWPTKSKALLPAKPGFDGRLRDLCEFTAEGRRQVLRAVDVVPVKAVNRELILLYWHIGLSIAARIVEECGTTFRIVLPMEKTA